MKVKKTKDQLKSDVYGQLHLLEKFCEEYDNGDLLMVKPISTCLRVLLKESGSSKSLLHQLGKRDIRWLNTSHGLHLDNQIQECSLMITRVEIGEGAKHLPKCQTNYSINDYKETEFFSWFNEKIILDYNKRTFTRREIIMEVAEKDGGAHVDPELNEEYNSIKDPVFNREIKYGIDDKGTTEHALGDIPGICIRQIAFEVLKTLREKYFPINE